MESVTIVIGTRIIYTILLRIIIGIEMVYKVLLRKELYCSALVGKGV